MKQYTLFTLLLLTTLAACRKNNDDDSTGSNANRHYEFRLTDSTNTITSTTTGQTNSYHTALNRTVSMDLNQLRDTLLYNNIAFRKDTSRRSYTSFYMPRYNFMEIFLSEDSVHLRGVWSNVGHVIENRDISGYRIR